MFPGLTVRHRTDNLHSHYTAGTIEGPVGDLKTYRLGDHEVAFAVSGKAKPDGSLFNPEKVEKPHTSGKLYKSMFVRHWDVGYSPLVRKHDC